MSARSLVQHQRILPKILNSFHYSTINSSTLFEQPFSANHPSIQATSVIKSYIERGLVNQARVLFDEMPERDVVAWSTMISGYVACDLHSLAWDMFRDMLRYGSDTQPNEFTFSSVLKACKRMDSQRFGTLVHALVLRKGFLASLYVANALMDMYAWCCNCINDASLIFEQIPVKNSVSWTTLIAGYTRLSDGYGGFQVFRQMLLETEPNAFSISIAIKACTLIGSHMHGKQIHATVVKHGYESSIPVMNSLLDMFIQCGCLSEADQCFNGMSERDIIAWNTLIAGYEKSYPLAVLNLYSCLKREGLNPDCFTFTSIVASVANIAVLSCGEQVHGSILRTGLSDDLGTANALIDMYAKCGSITNSRKIFCEMREKNVVSWTSMIIGYGSHGYGNEALELFDHMVRSGVTPDRIVLVAVLNACSHAGRVDEGLRYFKSMTNHYRIIPDQEIYGCVVDLLGRAGRVSEAYELIESMPFLPDESVWGPFLGACKAHKLADLGRLAASKVLDLKPSVTGTYMALSNMYAADGKWGDSAQMRKLLRGMGSKKGTGRSWIEVKNQIYSFVAGDRLDSQIEHVYEAIELLLLHMKELSYIPDLKCLNDDLEDRT